MCGYVDLSLWRLSVFILLFRQVFNFLSTTRALVGIGATYVSSWHCWTFLQDLVGKTFFELWFDEPTRHHTQHLGDGSVVPSEIAERAQQLVDVLRKLTSHQAMVTIIKRSLSLDFCPQNIKNSATSMMTQAAVRLRCELMCKCLLESVLKVNLAYFCSLFWCRNGLVFPVILDNSEISSVFPFTWLTYGIWLPAGRRNSYGWYRYSGLALCLGVTCFLHCWPYTVRTTIRSISLCRDSPALSEDSGMFEILIS